MILLSSRPKYLMQTNVIRRSPEWWSKNVEKKKQQLSPKAQLDNRFSNVNKNLAQPIEYKNWNWERIKVIKDPEWKSISVLKAVNPDKEIGSWDNIKSEVRLIKEDNWKYTLLSNERWSDNPDIDGNQMVTETSNDVWINKASEMLTKIEKRISEWKKIIKAEEDAKIKRMMDLAYQNDQNDADNMIEDLMNDESIA
jgi:hypothetical protein